MPTSQKVKSRGGYEAMAVRNLERARKVVARDGDGDNEAAVQVMVSSANVYALLELADAIRAGFDPEGATTPAPEEAPGEDPDEAVAQGEEGAPVDDAR